MSALSLAVVLLAVFLTTTWLAAWPLLGAARWWPRRGHLRELIGGRWNLLLLLAPPLVGLAVALGAVWPAAGAGPGWHCHCAQHVLPFHLCLEHPGVSLSLLPYAALLVLWLGRAPLKVVVELARRLRAARRLRTERAFVAATTAHGPVLLGELGQPNAFTLGLLRPVVIADRAWWRELPDDARAMVAAHEATHAEKRDPLAHALVLLLASLAPSRLGRPLAEAWLQFAEHRADRGAAAVVGDPLRVAELLVRAYRLPSSGEPALLPAFSGGTLELRVRALLELAGGGLPVAPDVRASLGLGLLAATGIALTIGYPIHLFVEKLLTLGR
jgi:Zn-dependent protease with chaperone function